MIKTILIAAAYLTFSVPTQASTIKEQFCNSAGEFAAVTMRARQIGVPKEDAIGALTQGETYRLTVAIVNLAYSFPFYALDSQKSSAINSFRDHVSTLCLTGETDI